jgi:predicted DNA-binding transcriptional regulator AlpA
MNFLRFKDLKQRGIVRNWTTLARLMREQGFPAGTRVGAQTRAWEEAEVTAWLDSRRIASPRPCSLAKSDALECAPRR